MTNEAKNRSKRASHSLTPNTSQGRDFVGVEHFQDRSRNAIGWCGRTQNFFRGCSPVSEGCKNCYAVDEGVHQVVLRPASPYARLVEHANGVPRWKGIVEPTAMHAWLAPFETGQRALAFANSMSDLFHENVRDEHALFAVQLMTRAPHFQWQVLTKRPERMRTFMSRVRMNGEDLELASAPLPKEARFAPKNIWLGVSVENQRWADERLPLLSEVSCAVRFVSIEPLLERVDLTRHVGSFDWVIAGGESGARFRPMPSGAAEEIRDLCLRHGVPFFFKQHAGKRPQLLSKLLDGQSWRQFPKVELLPLMSKDERARARSWVTQTYARIFSTPKP